MKLNVSQISSPGNLEVMPAFSDLEGLSLASSRNLPQICVSDL